MTIICRLVQATGVGKARSLPECGAPERYFTWVGTGLTYKVTNIRLG